LVILSSIPVPSRDLGHQGQYEQLFGPLIIFSSLKKKRSILKESKKLKEIAHNANQNRLIR